MPDSKSCWNCTVYKIKYNSKVVYVKKEEGSGRGERERETVEAGVGAGSQVRKQASEAFLTWKKKSVAFN